MLTQHDIDYGGEKDDRPMIRPMTWRPRYRYWMEEDPGPILTMVVILSTMASIIAYVTR